MNNTKTETTHINTDHTLNLNNILVEAVNEFHYFGNILSTDGTTSADIERRECLQML